MSHRKLLAIINSFMLVTVVAELKVGWVFAEDSQAAVTANREAYISAIVEKWQTEAVSMGFAETWSPEFTAALDKASVKQLLAVQAATSYDAVRAILQGRPAPVAVEGRVGVQNLGDLATDLTFTPLNPPCRIFDTRNYGGGVAPAGGTTRNYYAYGNSATITAQGGNTAGCPAPNGEPVGIAANFTAVPSEPGHLRVFPFGGALPTVSFLNFTPGVNIANAGIVSTCYLCSYDISVYNGSKTHHIGDVMGYFYPASPPLASLDSLIGLPCDINSPYSSGTVSIGYDDVGKVAMKCNAVSPMPI